MHDTQFNFSHLRVHNIWKERIVCRYLKFVGMIDECILYVHGSIIPGLSIIPIFIPIVEKLDV